MKLGMPQVKLRQSETFTSSTHEHILEEQEYIQYLKESLGKVVSQLQASSCDLRERYVRKEQVQQWMMEKEESIQAILQQNSKLKSENYNCKIKMEQYERHLKRYDIKINLLNNKVFHLNKILTQKQAIIKYLQAKNQRHTHTLTSKQPLADTSIDEYSRTYSKNSLSFAKLKTPTLKFQDYANYSLQIDESQDHFTQNGRVNRIKTETNEAKQNQTIENKSQGGSKKFQQFFNPKLVCKFENQKTLTKGGSRQSTSFWDYPGQKRLVNHENKKNVRNIMKYTSTKEI